MRIFDFLSKGVTTNIRLAVSKTFDKEILFQAVLKVSSESEYRWEEGS